ncbi:MAG: hypothetical protein Q9218_004962 [Villophora microphyllina]
MPHIVSTSVGESSASISPSFSLSSPHSLKSSPWLDIRLEEVQGPEYPGSRIKRLRTAPTSPPTSPNHGIPYETEGRGSQPGNNNQTPSTPQRTVQDRRIEDEVPYLPTPPESHDSDGGSEDSLPYPVNPRPFLHSPLPLTLSDERGRGLFRRSWVARTPIAASSTSPDRYISNRYTPQDSASSLRLGKSPHLLSPDEKLLRHNSATPDPFLSSPRRRRHGRVLTSSIDSRSATRSQTRSTSSHEVFMTPHHAHPPSQHRQASVGAVWNVGGGTHHPTGPVEGISDGRGGLIGSGTNSPLYTAKFSEKDAPEDDQDIYENRLAVALDIDRARKVLDFSRPQQRKPTPIGFKRKRADLVGRTQWRYGEWAREGDISRKPNHLFRSSTGSVNGSSSSKDGQARSEIGSHHPVPSLGCSSAQR